MFERDRSFCHISHQLFSFFLPSSVFQVYVSYDYGKSFQKISEKFNFGVGNGSVAVIAQFYHSPVDNRRVRRQRPTCGDFMGCVLGEGCAQGAWAMDHFVIIVS